MWTHQKVVGVARRGAIPHVRELTLVAELAALEELLRDGHVEDEVPVEELDLLDRLVTTRDSLRDVILKRHCRARRRCTQKR